MKLREILASLDLSASNPHAYIDGEEQSREFGLYNYTYLNLAEHGFKEIAFIEWLCTDTHVGATAIFMDDRLVAVAHQIARKEDKKFFFLGKDEAEAVRQKLLTLLPNEPEKLQFADLDEDLGDGFQVAYGTQLLTKDVIWRNQPAKIVKQYGLRYKGSCDNWRKVDLKVSGTVHEKVPLEEITIPFVNLKVCEECAT